MSSKTKSASGFKREKRDGRTVLVKKAGNGEVVKNGPADFLAYDSSGNYLGFFGEEATAAVAAARGRPSIAHIDSASDLSLWVAWNDGLDSGARVMADQDDRQIMCFSDSIFLRAHDDRKSWIVEVLTDAEMSDEYWDDGQCTFDLRVLNDGKFRLE